MRIYVDDVLNEIMIWFVVVTYMFIHKRFQNVI